MRKPRDIDAELKALTDRARALKSRRVTQLGELVIATGAGELDHELLAGALLCALDTLDDKTREAWTRRGEGFFRKAGKGRGAANAAVGAPAAQDAGGPHSPGASGAGA